ncbi:MAG: hypothetical protein N7Q72_01130, partial [Spiroplasma sp. Tabriz.8]|nr:hypothetical protein [Spiroplasma sp. Tabriz.8]
LFSLYKRVEVIIWYKLSLAALLFLIEYLLLYLYNYVNYIKYIYIYIYIYISYDLCLLSYI